MAILVWFLIGLISGLIARFLVPGRDRIGWLGTIILGLVGSLVGGFLGNVVFEGNLELSASGLVGSVIGAIGVFLIYRSTRSGATT